MPNLVAACFLQAALHFAEFDKLHAMFASLIYFVLLCCKGAAHSQFIAAMHS